MMPSPTQLRETTARHRHQWARRRAAMEQADYRNWRLGTNGYWRYRIKHQAILVFGRLLKLVGLYRYGYHNARQLVIQQRDVAVQGLPEAFQGYRILHLSDLHLDSIKGLGALLAGRIAGLSCDLCAITGDFRYGRHGQYRQVFPPLARILSRVEAADGVFAVLGNHDTQAMAEGIEALGIRLLTNESETVRRGVHVMRVVGVDDPHDYYTEQAEACLKAEAGPGFKVLLAHSPELYRAAADSGIGLYLCGHSHGGQICLPGGRPLMTYLNTGKRFYRGLWRFGSMAGHTSPGCGTAKIPIRFNCPPEVTVLTLRPAETVGKGRRR